MNIIPAGLKRYIYPDDYHRKEGKNADIDPVIFLPVWSTAFSPLSPLSSFVSIIIHILLYFSS